MSPKVNCTRRNPPPSNNVSVPELLPRLFADDDGNARPPLSGRGDARQPEEIANLSPRIASVEAENAICSRNFAVLKSLFSARELSDAISRSLLDMDLHLLHIAEFRGCRDFTAVAREARALGRTARALGAVRANAAANLLERACESGAHVATYRLLSVLSQACDEASTTLNELLVHNPIARDS